MDIKHKSLNALGYHFYKYLIKQGYNKKPIEVFQVNRIMNHYFSIESINHMKMVRIYLLKKGIWIIPNRLIKLKYFNRDDSND